MMVYIPGQRHCVLLIWVFVCLQALTVMLLYTFQTGGPPQTLTLRSNVRGQKVNDNEVRKHRGIMSYVIDAEKEKSMKKELTLHKTKELSIRESAGNGLSIEGDVVHLHIHSGKIIIHSDEISEEDFIRIKTTKSPKRRTTKSPSVAIHKRNVEKSSNLVKKVENRTSKRKTTTLKQVFKATTKRPEKAVKLVKQLHPENSKMVKSEARNKQLETKSGDRSKRKVQSFLKTTTKSSQTEIVTFMNLYLKECEQNLMNITYTMRGSTKTLCPCLPNGLGKF